MQHKIFYFNEWKVLQQNHKAEVMALVGNYHKNKSQQNVNPVIDFLFRYYNFSVNKLSTWSPGINSRLVDAAPYKDQFAKNFVVDGNDLILTIDSLKNNRIRFLIWTIELLKSVNSKKPLLNCCGLHEWAMVYKANEIRHESWPLRLSNSQISDVVESNPVMCTHFDAFRFFTDDAKPLNKNELSRDNFIDNEQPGCIHTNMDTYKWAYKFYPYVSSNCILTVFKQAMDARKIDMMASPYDLSSINYDPILIETEAGRVQYKQEQAAIWKKGIESRNWLIQELEIIAEQVQTHSYEL